MQLLLRLFIWVLAVVSAASPVLLAVASSPSHQSDIFAAASYANYARDVAFVIVAFIAIGMIDALEVVATLFGSRPAKVWAAGIAFVLVIVFIPLMMVFVTWAAPGQTTGLNINDIYTLGGASLVCAFGARVTAILGG